MQQLISNLETAHREIQAHIKAFEELQVSQSTAVLKNPEIDEFGDIIEELKPSASAVVVPQDSLKFISVSRFEIKGSDI